MKVTFRSYIKHKYGDEGEEELKSKLIHFISRNLKEEAKESYR
jgi:hypothetical protein